MSVDLDIFVNYYKGRLKLTHRLLLPSVFSLLLLMYMYFPVMC